MKKLCFFLTTLLCAQNPVYISGGGGGGGGTSPISTATFLLCAGPCAVNETTNFKWSATSSQTVLGCLIDAGIYPTGTNGVIVNIFKNPTITGVGTISGGTTIFTSTLPTLTSGGTTFNEQTGMAAAASMVKGDYLVAQVTTIGGTIAGQLVNVSCRIQ